MQNSSRFKSQKDLSAASGANRSKSLIMWMNSVYLNLEF